MRKLLLRVTLATLTLCMPIQAFGAVLLQADDTIAGLSAEITGKNLTPRATYQMILTPPAGPHVTQRITTDGDGAFSTMVTGRDTTHAGMYSAALAQDRQNIAEAEFEVSPDRLDPGMSDVSVRHGDIVADGRDEAEVTISLTDMYGNPLPGRPVELIGSGDEMIEPLERETDAWGEQRFVITTRRAGRYTLRAMDLLSSTLLTARAEISADDGRGIGGHTYAGQVIDRAAAEEDFDVIDRFEITVDPPVLETREVARNVLIQAVDRNGRVVGNYTGPVRIFSPTDPSAVLPGFEDGYGETTFTPRERGEKNLRLIVSFLRAGEQILRVEDRTNPSQIIFGETSIMVGGSSGNPAGGTIKITSHNEGGFVSSRTITLTGIAEPFVSLRVMVNGVDKTQGETLQDGSFAIPLALDASIEGAFTIRIQDPVHGQDSGPLTLTLDSAAPEVATVTFAPEKPVEGSTMLVSLISEPGLSEVLIRIGTQTHMLIETPPNSGKYQAAVTAPLAGAHQPTVVIKDKGGNTRELRTTLLVLPSGLPTVKNVRAEGRANAVELSWDAVTGETIDGYRVYVGEEDGNFLYTLDTGKPTTSAAVAGLRPATNYYFAVTAIKGERESAEKSATASALVLGTKLEIDPEDSALFLEWAFPEEKPLSSFLLEYGAEKGTYTERRVLNGALRAFTLRDLLNGVTYYVRLTPVATTGDVLSDLSAVNAGAPEAAGPGFHASAPDPLPFDPDKFPPANELHEGAPRTPTTGLPPVAIWSGLGFAAFLLMLQWHRRRTLRMTQAFIAAMEQRYKL